MKQKQFGPITVSVHDDGALELYSPGPGNAVGEDLARELVTHLHAHYFPSSPAEVAAEVAKVLADEKVAYPLHYIESESAAPGRSEATPARPISDGAEAPPVKVATGRTAKRKPPVRKPTTRASNPSQTASDRKGEQ
jgi:hypothetical protein